MPNRVEDTGQELVHGDELSEQLAGMARELAEPVEVQSTLQRVVDVAVRAVTNCDSASLMVVHRRQVDTPAYSSALARDADLAQYAADEGPCLDVIRESDTFLIEDFGQEQRWPAYRSKVDGFGFGSQLAVRLFMVGDTLGALNLYSQRPYAFDRRSVTIAQVFAAHAAIAMKAALTEEGLRTALKSRDVIGQAKGIVMAELKVTADLAFDVLTDLSQHRNVKLRDLAEQIAALGQMPDT